jgi:hypothetical protein
VAPEGAVYMSEEENMGENVEENTPEINFEDFRGVIEYMSRFFTRARLPFGELPTEISQNILGTDNDNEHANYEIAFYLGAIDKLMSVLNAVDFDELARSFFTSKEKVLEYMRIMSDLATLLFDIKDKKITEKSDIIYKLDSITDRLKAYIVDLIEYLDKGE